MHVRNKKSGISPLYLPLCGFFFSCFAFSFPNLRQIRNREFFFHITCFFRASLFLLFLLFCHETKFHSSNSSMLCQLHAAAKPSTASDVSVIVPHPCWRNNLYSTTQRWRRQWWSNRRETEQMELGEGQGRMKNTPIHDLFIWGSEIGTFGWRTPQNCVQTQRDGVHKP